MHVVIIIFYKVFMKNFHYYNFIDLMPLYIAADPFTLFNAPHVLLPELLLEAEEEVEEGVGGVVTAEETVSYLLIMESVSIS